VVLPAAVEQVSEARAPDGHELALHGREEERAAVQRHGLLQKADDVAATRGAVVARTAGVEEQRGLARGDGDGGDLMAVAGPR
jgi:hypothetical protein